MPPLTSNSFDEIRDLFTELPESKLAALHSGHFSFNVKEGSCTYCGGLGQVKIDMDFMEDAWVMSAVQRANGSIPRFWPCKFKGKNIHDVLEMDVEHALELFECDPLNSKKLEVLKPSGPRLSYFRTAIDDLSGGEAQRIKLAKELVRPSTGKTLYILDEPTTGLHFHDIKKLIAILQRSSIKETPFW